METSQKTSTKWKSWRWEVWRSMSTKYVHISRMQCSTKCAKSVFQKIDCVRYILWSFSARVNVYLSVTIIIALAVVAVKRMLLEYIVDMTQKFCDSKLEKFSPEVKTNTESSELQWTWLEKKVFEKGGGRDKILMMNFSNFKWFKSWICGVKNSRVQASSVFCMAKISLLSYSNFENHKKKFSFKNILRVTILQWGQFEVRKNFFVFNIFRSIFGPGI